MNPDPADTAPAPSGPRRFARFWILVNKAEELVGGPLSALVLIVFLLACTLLAGWVSERLLDVLTLLKDDPRLLWPSLLAFVGCLLLALLFSVAIETLRILGREEQEERMGRIALNELRQKLDPKAQEGFLYALYAKLDLLADPDLEGSPLGPYFHKQAGRVPETLAQAKQHLGHAEELLKGVSDSIRSMSRDHEDFRLWTDEWRQSAVDVMGVLKTDYFRRRGMLMEPADYINFLSEVEREKIGGRPARYPNTIRLVGSMVGFAFLLPQPLRNYACVAKDGFRRLHLMGVDIEAQETFWYSVFLVAQTIRKMLTCPNVLKLLEDDHAFIFETRYSDHSLMGAVFDIPNVSLAALQALDGENFRAILEGVGQEENKRYQLGFRFDNREGERDEYSCYASSLDNIWNHFATRTEVWLLHRTDDGSLLNIWNPRWTCDGLNSGRARTKARPVFETQGSKNRALLNEPTLTNLMNNLGAADIRVPQGEVEGFLDGLITAIPRQNPEIQQILDVFQSKRPQFSQLREDECECRRAKSHPSPATAGDPARVGSVL